MRIRHIEASPHPGGLVRITAVVDGDITSVFEQVRQAKEGLARKPNGEYKREYDLLLKAHYESKTDRQLKAIWGKIGEIAAALETSKDEVYEICTKRYGQGIAARVDEKGLADIKRMYRFVEVVQSREDNTYFVKAWRSLSTYNSQEAKVLLDGILSECRECGINDDIGEYR